MEIKELIIFGFGKHSNQSYSFQNGLNLVAGDNESGKSTLLECVRTVLYGFPGKRERRRDFTPFDHPVYGASLVLEHEHYGQVKITRLFDKQKGQAQVILADGQELGEAFLSQLLGVMTKEVFDHIFCLRQEELIQVEQLSPQQLQQLLMAVGVSGHDCLTQAADQLAKKRQELFKPSGRNPILNQRIKSFYQLEERIAERERHELAAQQQAKDIEQLTMRIAEYEEHDHWLMEQIAQLKKQEAMWPLFDEYQRLIATSEYNQPLPLEIFQRIEQDYQQYRYFVQQEQDLIEQQLADSPLDETAALRFYERYRSQLDHTVDQSYYVQQLSERHTQLLQQKRVVNSEADQLAEQLKCPKETIVKISNQDFLQLEELAKEELRVDEALEQVANQLANYHFSEQQQTAERSESALSDLPLSWLLGAAGMVVGAIGLFLAQQSGWALLLVVVGVILGLTYFRKSQNRYLNKRGRLRSGLAEKHVTLQEKHDKQQTERQRIQMAKQKLSQKYGLPLEQTILSWLSLLPARDRYMMLNQQLDQINQELAHIEQQLAEKLQAITFVRMWVPLVSSDVASSYQQVVQFVKRCRKDQTALRDQATMQELRLTIDHIRQKKANIEQQILMSISSFGDMKIEQLADWLEQQREQQKAAQRIADLSYQLSDLFDSAETYSLTVIQQERKQMEIDQTTQRSLIADLHQKYQQIQYEQQALASDLTLERLYQERQRLTDQIESLGKQMLSLTIAEQLAIDLFDQLSSQQMPRLLQQVSRFFGQLTLARYRQVLIQNDQLVVIDAEQHLLSISQLSTGTKHQLYLAFRLSFMRIYDGLRLPLIIDDGWLYFDRTRKQQLLNLLEELAERQQIICLSSDVFFTEYFQSRNKYIICLNGGVEVDEKITRVTN